MQDRYFERGVCLCCNKKDGPEQLTNFASRISEELIYHDGKDAKTYLVVQGKLHDPAYDEAHGITDDTEDPAPHELPKWGRPLPSVTVPASEFAGMGWVPNAWGSEPIIYPVAGSERETATAIKSVSRPTKQHIYTHTGWTDDKKDDVFLVANGGITAKGLDTSIRVQLPHELSHYQLPPPRQDKAAFLDSLRLVNIGKPKAVWPLLLAAYRAALGPSDFAMHLAGRTGTYKSELMALIQSHYGAGFTARNLPGSWSSTGNALEALAYRAKNVPMTVDDFVPHGNSYHIKQLQMKADALFRGAGNQAGRSRMSDVADLRTTFYARGLILSTGEDVPEGHSVRGRMMIVELEPGDITPAALTRAQNAKAQYSQAVADWVQWIAGTSARDMLKELRQVNRDKHLGIGHTRTPSMIGDLLATAYLLISEYATDAGFLSKDQADAVMRSAEAAVLETANSQKEFLETADPVEALKEAIRGLLNSQTAHVATPNGGVPSSPERYGYTLEGKKGEAVLPRKNGPRLGWVDHEAGELLLDPNVLAVLKRAAGGKLAVTPQTLFKRMKEAGLITRCDSERKRLTVRQVLDGHRRQALCLDLAEVMDDESEPTE